METIPLRPPAWVSTPEGLQRLAHSLQREPRLAVDTESNSLYAYREQVCLIQISVPEQDFLVDPLAIPDLSPLAPIFASSNIEKIFHAAEYDLIGLRRDFDIQAENIFDTMQAARILGYQQVGLDSILADKFGIKVNKRHQKANWGRRPLPADMLEYASQDSHFLRALRDLFHAELLQEGLWELAHEEFVRISHHVNQNGNPAEPAWLRVSGARKLTPRQAAILNELCAWREKQAERMDRPVFKVIGEGMLMSLAQRAPKSARDLEATGATDRQIQLFGHDLLRAIQRGLAVQPIRIPDQRRRSDAVLRRQEALKKWRKLAAQSLGVESDIILPRAFLHTIAELNPQDIEALKGCMPDSPWRIERYGETILSSLKSAR